MVKTENTRAKNNRLRREARAWQDEIVVSLCQVLNLPTHRELEDHYAGYPSRLHIAPENMDLYDASGKAITRQKKIMPY